MQISTSCTGAGIGASVKLIMMKEKSYASVLFYPSWSSSSLSPSFSPLTPASARSFSPILLYSDFHFHEVCFCSDIRFPEIAGCLGPFSAPEMASDVHPTASPVELQSHRRILAPGLTERINFGVSFLMQPACRCLPPGVLRISYGTLGLLADQA